MFLNKKYLISLFLWLVVCVGIFAQHSYDDD